MIAEKTSNQFVLFSRALDIDWGRFWLFVANAVLKNKFCYSMLHHVAYMYGKLDGFKVW